MQKEEQVSNTTLRNQLRGEEECRFWRRKKKMPSRQPDVRRRGESGPSIGQCGTEVQDLKDKPRRNEELKSLEVGMPKLKESEKAKNIEKLQGNDKSGM